MAAALIWGNLCGAAKYEKSISAASAVLMHDGQVLYGKNEN